MRMTTTYRQHDQPAKPSGPVRPVAVRSQTSDAKPKTKSVKVTIEHGCARWFIRGMSMGAGFSLAVWILRVTGVVVL